MHLEWSEGHLECFYNLRENYMEAAKNAELEWTRIQSNMSFGANELYSAEGITDEPKWPELSMNEIFEIAFKQKIIKRPDHFVLKQLLGES